MSLLPVRGYHPLRRAFPGASRLFDTRLVRSYYPGCALTPPVWTLSLSLATTQDIDISFSSFGY